jgi:hypothetical protein
MLTPEEWTGQEVLDTELDIGHSRLFEFKIHAKVRSELCRMIIVVVIKDCCCHIMGQFNYISVTWKWGKSCEG